MRRTVTLIALAYHAVLAVKDEREDALAACGGLRSLTAARAVISESRAIPPDGNRWSFRWTHQIQIAPLMALARESPLGRSMTLDAWVRYRATSKIA